MSEALSLHLWRHPRLRGADGLCIGALDWPVDSRRARRLAQRIDRDARVHRLPRAIATSPLARCRAVADALRALHWRVIVDPRLQELDFGCWQGRPWHEIPRAEIAAWEQDFLHHRPGGGESIAALRARLRSYLADVARGARPMIAVTHGGCIAALCTLSEAQPQRWPPAPAPGAVVRLALNTAEGLPTVPSGEPLPAASV